MPVHKKSIVVFIGTLGGSGYWPRWFGYKKKGGGLVGSLIALFMQWIILYFWGGSAWLGTVAVLFAVSSLFLGLVIGDDAMKDMTNAEGATEKHTGEKTTTDHNPFNLDEFHGQWLVALPVFLWPVRIWWFDEVLCLVGFALFRWLDVKKVGPIERIERWLERTFSPGYAAMLDDTVAAGLASIPFLMLHMLI